MRPTAPARSTGFSLIELAIVMSIVGVLYMIMMPTFQKWLQSTQVRTVAESIESGLQLARGEAMRRNVQVEFLLLGTENGTSVANSAGTDWAIYADDQTQSTPHFGTLIRQRNATNSSNVLIGLQTGANSPSSPATAGANMTSAQSIIFNGAGRLTPSTSASEIDLLSKTTGRNLAIVLSGAQLRLCDPAFSIANNPQGC